MIETKFTNKTTALSLIVLLSVSLFSGVAFAEEKKKSNVNLIKIQYLAKISANSYYIQFKTCLGNNSVNNPSFSINSDTDSKFVTYQKVHLANTCKNYETNIEAKNSNSISILMTNGMVKK
ncbi:MAG: hypothetical protein K5790_07745 [Nitrosopumilus sp.]|uniref:hypothetical protein n=1 Tax=Nitrosopumilus sp. TaxID=2024843 RepID=UPI00247BBC27|nr:hypothetical protein [Nitrosopumilus sp.]MCV0393160.1 hypothetical protein [Nitrosopumilus sp.]